MKNKVWPLIFIFLLLITSIVVSMPQVVKADSPEGWTEYYGLTDADQNSSTRAKIAVDSVDNLHIAYCEEIDVENSTSFPYWALIIGFLVLVIMMIIIGIKMRKKPENTDQYQY